VEVLQTQVHVTMYLGRQMKIEQLQVVL